MAELHKEDEEEKTTTAPAEDQPAPAEDKPEDRPEDKPEDKPEDTPPDDTPPEDTPPDDKPAEHKPDLSQISKEEKQAYAFRKQMEKQKSKYENMIQDIKGEFTKQIDDLKETFKKAQKEAEPRKTRKDFETDDDYISYLAEERVNSIMEVRDREAAEKAAEVEKSRKEQEREERERAEEASQFNETCRRTFSDPKEYAEFGKRVELGVKNGLASVLDQAPVIRDYVFRNQDGPLVLDEMLKNRDAFVRIYSRHADPDDCRIEMHVLARELRSRPAQPAGEPAETGHKGMPSIGKPGSAAPSSNVSKDMFDNDQDLINYVRNH
jgi:hypothetical protein